MNECLSFNKKPWLWISMSYLLPVHADQYSKSNFEYNTNIRPLSLLTSTDVYMYVKALLNQVDLSFN